MKSKLKEDTHLKLKELELALVFVVLHHSSHRLVSYGVFFVNKLLTSFLLVSKLFDTLILHKFYSTVHIIVATY